jgi:hypothetical protein
MRAAFTARVVGAGPTSTLRNSSPVASTIGCCGMCRGGVERAERAASYRYVRRFSRGQDMGGPNDCRQCPCAIRTVSRDSPAPTVPTG